VSPSDVNSVDERELGWVTVEMEGRKEKMTRKRGMNPGRHAYPSWGGFWARIMVEDEAIEASQEYSKGERSWPWQTSGVVERIVHSESRCGGRRQVMT